VIVGLCCVVRMGMGLIYVTSAHEITRLVFPILSDFVSSHAWVGTGHGRC
jgi:hypothetical protein